MKFHWNKRNTSRLSSLVLVVLMVPLVLADPPRVVEATNSEESELEALREMERKVTATLERVRDSFVFIQGGSGFLISDDGYILTNEHVVAQPNPRGKPIRELTVTFRGGKQLKADVVGHDPGGDVALLKLRQPPGRRPFELGDSDAIEIGQPIIALGDPFLVGSDELFLKLAAACDYEPAASTGIVSALHRWSQSYPDSIQVDAAVNPGNSGGPLLTLDGKVVGINGKIENPFGVGINAGIGYAIPINQVKRFLEPLKRAEGGIVRHGSLPGVRVARRAGRHPGLPIDRVTSNSPAARYGFRSGDVVTSIAGLGVTTFNRFHGILATFPEGSEVPFRILRGDRGLEITARLIEPGRAYIGIEIDVDSEVKGVRIAAVTGGGPADRAKLQVDDVVRKIADETIDDTSELKSALADRIPGDRVQVVVERAGESVELELVLGERPEE